MEMNGDFSDFQGIEVVGSRLVGSNISETADLLRFHPRTISKVYRE